MFFQAPAYVQAPAYTDLTPAEAAAVIREGKAVLTDVRESSEYAESHIPGAVPLPLSVLSEKAAEVLPDPSVPVLVYCRSGVRSVKAAKILASMGYKEIYNLKGGFLAWPYERT